LRNASFCYTRLGDIGMLAICRSKNLEVLDVSNAGITDAGTKGLRHCPNVTDLRMRGNNISNESMRIVCTSCPLEELDVGETLIDDGCIGYFASLPRLKRLSLDGTRITADGLRRLRLLLPNADIYPRD
jgi:Leucine-rich repeat (LRR) protein